MSDVRSEIHRQVWRGRAVLAVAGVVVGLMFCELVVRLVGPALPTSFTSRALQELHPIYGVFHRPGASAWMKDEEFTTFVGFNRDGLRGREVTAAPQDSRTRVLVVGDSFVEGAEVDEKDVMPSVLAGRLTANGCPAESLNAGVRGWGTAQQYLYLAHEGLRFRPDVVVLVVYVGNDLVDNSLELSESAPDGVLSRPFFTLEQGGLVQTASKLRPTPPFAPALELARAHSSLFNLAESGVAVKLGSADGAEVLRSVHRLAFATPPTPAWERAWAVTEALIVAARDNAEAQGARFLLVAAPHKGQLDQTDWERLIRGAPLRKDVGWDPRLPQDRLRGVAQEHGIQAVDLLPPLEAAHGSAPLYFAENSHWTAKGHDVAAEAVAGAILGGGSCRMR